MKTGRLYWITGLSGAGKTSLSQCFYHRLKRSNQPAILLDGDELRGIYQLPGQYDLVGRRSMSMRHARLCAMLTQQNHDVICATISMFDEVRQWLKTNIEHYVEIYLTAPDDLLEQRRMVRYQSDLTVPTSVVGKDIAAELPESPDVTLLNDGRLSIAELCNQLEFALKSEILKNQANY